MPLSNFREGPICSYVLVSGINPQQEGLDQQRDIMTHDLAGE
jgi:hypothetical protein